MNSDWLLCYAPQGVNADWLLCYVPQGLNADQEGTKLENDVIVVIVNGNVIADAVGV